MPTSLFQQVYNSPAALPGKQRWVTSEKDVRTIERRLGLEAGAIGAPLWVSGDSRNCAKCGRETSWLDIVESGLAKAHDSSLLIKVILGDRKFVNTEAPRAIADLVCSKCKSPIPDLRSSNATTGHTHVACWPTSSCGQPRNGRPLVDAE